VLDSIIEENEIHLVGTSHVVLVKGTIESLEKLGFVLDTLIVLDW